MTADLPSLDEMRDTLGFVWRHFLGELVDEWKTRPGAELARDWDGAAVAMRVKPITAAVNGPETAILLSVRGTRQRFRLEGMMALDLRSDTADEEIVWQSFGDHRHLVGWMVPWVSKHVEEGGGAVEV